MDFAIEENKNLPVFTEKSLHLLLKNKLLSDLWKQNLE